jgi:hypothetical protein
LTSTLIQRRADPKEKRNLWHDPAYAAVKQELKEQMLEWYVQSTLRTKNARKRTVVPLVEPA